MARAIVIICSMFYFEIPISLLCDGVLLVVRSCLGRGEREMRSVISVIIIREGEIR